jgi:uncharacterized membrane protein YkoI
MFVVAKIFIELLVLLVLAVVPISVFARQFGDTSGPKSAQEFRQSENAGTSKGAKAFVNVRVTIQRAIAIAETRSAGAKIVDIGFDDESDQVAYKVKTYQHNEIWTGTIDASTGEIIGEGVVTAIASLEGKEKAELVSFRASRMDLSEAIAIAEEFGIGSAVSAGLEERNGKPIFVVVVVADGTLKEVSVEMAQSCRVNKACACRQSNPDILVVQPAENWAAKNLPSPFDGARERRILLQGEMRARAIVIFHV